MSAGNILLIVVGVILLVAILILVAGGAGMGAMAMMAGMMATPFGWVALLIILAVGSLLAYVALVPY